MSPDITPRMIASRALREKRAMRVKKAETGEAARNAAFPDE